MDDYLSIVVAGEKPQPKPVTDLVEEARIALQLGDKEKAERLAGEVQKILYTSIAA